MAYLQVTAMHIWGYSLHMVARMLFLLEEKRPVVKEYFGV